MLYNFISQLQLNLTVQEKNHCIKNRRFFYKDAFAFYNKHCSFVSWNVSREKLFCYFKTKKFWCALLRHFKFTHLHCIRTLLIFESDLFIFSESNKAIIFWFSLVIFLFLIIIFLFQSIRLIVSIISIENPTKLFLKSLSSFYFKLKLLHRFQREVQLSWWFYIYLYLSLKNIYGFFSSCASLNSDFLCAAKNFASVFVSKIPSVSSICVLLLLLVEN